MAADKPTETVMEAARLFDHAISFTALCGMYSLETLETLKAWLEQEQVRQRGKDDVDDAALALLLQIVNLYGNS